MRKPARCRLYAANVAEVSRNHGQAEWMQMVQGMLILTTEF